MVQVRSEDNLAALFAALAPRPFALVGEGDEDDVEIIGWGLDTGESAYTISCDGQVRGAFDSPEDAARLFSRSDTPVRPVWW